MTTSSYAISAPKPGRPTTSAEYFADADALDAHSCSWALAISGLAGSLTSLVVVSDPAMLPVPVQRPPEALAQINGGGVPDLGPRARDVEGPAFREEVDAASIERRLHAERRAQYFAHGAGDPHRPHRNMPAGPGDSRRGRDPRIGRAHV